MRNRAQRRAEFAKATSCKEFRKRSYRPSAKYHDSVLWGRHLYMRLIDRGLALNPLRPQPPKRKRHKPMFMKPLVGAVKKVFNSHGY